MTAYRQRPKRLHRDALHLAAALRQAGWHRAARLAPLDVHPAALVQLPGRGQERLALESRAPEPTEEEIANDTRRTLELQRLGYRVFRVCNDDVYHNLDCVLDALLAFIEEGC